MASAAQVFELMGKAVEDVGPSLVPKVKGVIKFDVSGAGIWLVDLKNGKGKVTPSNAADKADLTISVTSTKLTEKYMSCVIVDLGCCALCCRFRSPTFCC